MPRTEVRSGQIRDATVGRSDVNVATPGEAVVAKIVAGSGINVSSTGADVGTGDVTITATVGGLHAPTHAVAGADSVDIKQLAGFPGTIDTVLRGNTTFGTISTSAITGLGTMAYQNYSAVNITGGTISVNTLTATVVVYTPFISMQGNPHALIRMISTAGAVDNKNWNFVNQATDFYLYLENDAGSINGQYALTFKRNGLNLVNGYTQAPVFGIGVAPLSSTIGLVSLEFAANKGITCPNVLNLATGVYFTDGWRHYGGTGGAVLVINANGDFDFWSAPVGSAGVAAGFSKTITLSASTGNATFTGNITSANPSPSFDDTGLVLKADDSTGADLYLNARSTDTYSGIYFRNYAGTVNHAGIFSNIPNSLQFFLVVKSFYMNASGLYPDAGSTGSIGIPSSYWSRMFSVQYVCSTAGGYAFTDSNVYGTFHDGSYLYLRNSGVNQFYMDVSGNVWIAQGIFTVNPGQLRVRSGGTGTSLPLSIGCADKVDNGIAWDTTSSTWGLGIATPGSEVGITLGLSSRSMTIVASAMAPYPHNAVKCGTQGQQWSEMWSVAGINNVSDMRYKTDFRDNLFGLDFINKIDTFSFKWKNSKSDARIHYGISAQQLDELGYDGIIKPVEDNDPYCLNYAELIPSIIKSIQELDRKVESWKNSN